MTVRSEAPRATPAYVLGHSERELERLATQARMVDPFTRHFFQAAGIVPGLRVLDVGCGPGDVSFLAAQLVGEGGEIIGVDRATAPLKVARARAEARSLRHVTFMEGDPTDMAFERPFDAVIGRYVLMFQKDPSEMLRKLAAHLRPEGVIVFHEPDWDGARSFPPASIYDRCCRWIVDTLLARGHETRMGKKLHSAFVAAGLPAPAMGVEALIGGGQKGVEGLQLIADLIETMLPAMEDVGVTTAKEVGLETLAARMIHEAVSNDSVIVGRYEIGAWTRASSSPRNRGA
jgi:2-polyprenyl-3-methyl-5-hydroxy-6-metoxy-1,4-benzoquinol methylase